MLLQGSLATFIIGYTLYREQPSVELLKLLDSNAAGIQSHRRLPFLEGALTGDRIDT